MAIDNKVQDEQARDAIARSSQVKICKVCGAIYANALVVDDECSWSNLQLVGYLHPPDGDDEITSIEMRNCTCGTTLALGVPS